MQYSSMSLYLSLCRVKGDCALRQSDEPLQCLSASLHYKVHIALGREAEDWEASKVS